MTERRDDNHFCSILTHQTVQGETTSVESQALQAGSDLDQVLDQMDGDLGEGDRSELVQSGQVDQTMELSVAPCGLVELEPGHSSQEGGQVLEVQHQLHVQTPALGVREVGGDGESCGDVLVDRPGQRQGTSVCQHRRSRPEIILTTQGARTFTRLTFSTDPPAWRLFSRLWD